MDYECQIMPIDKVPLNVKGHAEPICQSCTTVDCTNPIRDKTVCVLGQMKKLKLYVVGNMIRQVIACKGYSGNVSLQLDDINSK